MCSAAARRWLDDNDANCSSGAEEGREDTSAARLLAAEELAPDMRVVKALTRQDLHTGQARPQHPAKWADTTCGRCVSLLHRLRPHLQPAQLCSTSLAGLRGHCLYEMSIESLKVWCMHPEQVLLVAEHLEAHLPPECVGAQLVRLHARDRHGRTWELLVRAWQAPAGAGARRRMLRLEQAGGFLKHSGSRAGDLLVLHRPPDGGPLHMEVTSSVHRRRFVLGGHSCLSLHHTSASSS